MEDVLATVVDQLIIIVAMESCIDQILNEYMKFVMNEIFLIRVIHLDSVLAQLLLNERWKEDSVIDLGQIIHVKWKQHLKM